MEERFEQLRQLLKYGQKIAFSLGACYVLPKVFAEELGARFDGCARAVGRSGSALRVYLPSALTATTPAAIAAAPMPAATAVLPEDVSFNSPSTAAVFVLGGSRNGWAEWIDDAGRTLDEVYRK